MTPSINLGLHMRKRRFEDISSKFHFAFIDETTNNSSLTNYDPWFTVSKLISDFNKNRFIRVAASTVKLLDESMSAYKPRKDKTGGLPNISYIQRKPEPLGTEFKSVCCGVTGIMLHLEIQRGKGEMDKRSEYFVEFGATSSCAIRCMKATVNCGQNLENHTTNIFMGDSWFSSIKTADAIADYGQEWVGPVKTAHKFYPKLELEAKMKNWPGGMH